MSLPSLCLSLALIAAHVSQGSELYVRPPNSKDLRLDDPILARKPKAPHNPEQIHLSLAGPGRVAVSWVTWPWFDSKLVEEVGAMRSQTFLGLAGLPRNEVDTLSLGPREPQLPRSRRYLGPQESSIDHLGSTASFPAPSPEALIRKEGKGQHIRTKVSKEGNITRIAVETDYTHRKDLCEHLQGYPLEPLVEFWEAGSDEAISALGTFSCYNARKPFEYASGALQSAIMGLDKPLASGVLYHYKVGDPEFGWSDILNFTMVPDISADSVPYRLGLIGDLGQTEDSAKTLKHLDKLNVATVLNVGDLSYADDYQPRWDSWGRLIQFHASKIPWMHIEGNHEQEEIDGEEGFVAYNERFYFPAEESGSHSSMYYSYETGPIHVTMLGCYDDYGRDSLQFAWLQSDLASVDRSKTPWLVVGMHAPWYNSNSAHYGEMDSMRDIMEPLLHQHGVDIVFAGHVHAQERSKRGVLAGQPADCAPYYVTIGDGGNREGLATEYLDKPTWSGFREASFGMGVFEIHNSTHALWQWHRNQDAVTTIGDEFWLVRDPHCPHSGL